MPRLRSTARDWLRIGLGVLALGLASCAVVPPSGAAGAGAAGPGAAGQDEAAAAAANRAEVAAVLARPECRRMAGQRARLQQVHAALARAGMALQVLGCPQLPAAAAAAAAAGGAAAPGQQVIAVAVLVVDGERAADSVRGPLADGMLLDMGTPVPQEAHGLAQRVSSASLAQPHRDTLSPDVLYNRAWLRKHMAAQGLRPAAPGWWAFAPR